MIRTNWKGRRWNLKIKVITILIVIKKVNITSDAGSLGDRVAHKQHIEIESLILIQVTIKYLLHCEWLGHQKYIIHYVTRDEISKFSFSSSIIKCYVFSFRAHLFLRRGTNICSLLTSNANNEHWKQMRNTLFWYSNGTH